MLSGTRLFTIALSLLLSLSSWGRGDEICNGGDVVLCPKKEIRVLDIVERDSLYNLAKHPREDLIRNSRSIKIESVLAEIIRPIKKNAPELHQCILSYFVKGRLLSEVKFVSEFNFKDIQDETVYAIPKGCEKKQAALQFRNVMPYSGFRYLIHRGLWDRMDEFQQASLLLHEIILRIYVQSPDWNGNTTYVRYLTALIASADAQKLRPEQFQHILQGVAFTCTPYK